MYNTDNNKLILKGVELPDTPPAITGIYSDTGFFLVSEFENVLKKQYKCSYIRT